MFPDWHSLRKRRCVPLRALESRRSYQEVEDSEIQVDESSEIQVDESSASFFPLVSNDCVMGCQSGTETWSTWKDSVLLLMFDAFQRCGQGATPRL